MRRRRTAAVAAALAALLLSGCLGGGGPEFDGPTFDFEMDLSELWQVFVFWGIMVAAAIALGWVLWRMRQEKQASRRRLARWEDAVRRGPPAEVEAWLRRPPAE